MKNKLTTFLLTIIMIILLSFIILVGFVLFSDMGENSADQIYKFVGEDTIEDSSNTVENKISIKDENVTEKLKAFFSLNESNQNKEYSYSAKSSESNYYYNQLNSVEKIIYNGIQESKENMKSGTYVINYGNKFADILSKENGSEILGEYYQAAIEAFTHDNVDMFYLNANKLFLNIETTKKLTKTTYNVYISPEQNKTYYLDGFTSEAQVTEAISRIEMVKDNVIASLTGNIYKDILRVHDYLVDNIEYDTSYKSIGSYGIYGALVKNTCVCEGYAKAFKYLANAGGIECELVQGNATNSEGKVESHAWNAVKINDKWYYLDTTWDDPVIIGGGTLTARNKYRYFLKGKETFKKDHTEINQFTENGKNFSYPEVNNMDYR